MGLESMAWMSGRSQRPWEQHGERVTDGEELLDVCVYLQNFASILREPRDMPVIGPRVWGWVPLQSVMVGSLT